jgi:hypothetical protein
MIDWSTTQKAIYSWFFSATGFQTAWADQERPQDAIGDGFGTLRVQAFTPEAQPEKRTREGNDGDLYEDSIQTHLLTINCQVATASQDFEKHAMNVLAKAQAKLDLREYQEALSEAGLSVVSTGTLSNISAIAGAGFESRASMDVVFRVAAVTEAENASGYFNKIEMTANGVLQPMIGPPPDEE